MSKKNIFQKLFSKKESQTPPKRGLPQRMTAAERDIDELFESLDSLASDMSALGGRVGSLEEKPSVPLPDGYEHQTDPETGEDIIVFVGDDGFESFDDFESFDGDDSEVPYA